MLRIEGRLGLSFWDFACRWADLDGEIALNHAPHFHFSDDRQTPFVICLRHGVSQNFPGTTKCSFLQETPPDAEHPLGVARCGIYEQRPGACRAFPTRLNASRELAVIYDVPPRGRDGDSPAYQLCPRPWTAADVDPLETVQDLVVAEYEMRFFQSLAQQWNRRAGSWSVFPDFLRMVYSNRVLPQEQLESESPTLPMHRSQRRAA